MLNEKLKDKLNQIIKIKKNKLKKQEIYYD